MKKIIILAFATLLMFSQHAYAQCFGFGYPCTPMGVAIQAQTIALQQFTNQLIYQIKSQTVMPFDGYVPAVPVSCYVESAPVTHSDNVSEYRSSHSRHLINCSSCNNSGICSYCNGTGYGRTGGLGIRTLDSTKTCIQCGGSGICPICHGNHM